MKSECNIQVEKRKYVIWYSQLWNHNVKKKH